VRVWAYECEESGEAEVADGERRMERSDKRTITRGEGGDRVQYLCCKLRSHGLGVDKQLWNGTGMLEPVWMTFPFRYTTQMTVSLTFQILKQQFLCKIVTR